MSLAKNSLLYIISTICIKATSFLLLPLYTYLITPEEYGYVYVTSAFVTFMSLFMIISLNGSIQRFYFDCSTEKEIKQLYTNIVTIVLILVLCIGSILIVFRQLISETIGLPLRYYNYAVYISILSAFYPLILALLYASEKAKQVSIVTIFLGIIGIIIQLTLVLVKTDKGLALIQAMFFNALFSFIIFLIYSKKYFTSPKFTKKDYLKYCKYSLSQWPSDISVWLVSFSDRLLLNKLKGAYDTGIYGMGSTLGQIPQILFHSVNKAYVPYVFRHYKEYECGNYEAANIISNVTTKLFSILTFIITALIILSNNIIGILAPQFQNSSYIMPLILLAVLIDCSRIIFMNPLSYNLKYIKIKSAIWFFSAICNIALNIILIPRYSAIGACLSVIFSYSITLLLILFFAKKAMPIQYEILKIRKVLCWSLFFSTAIFIGDDMVTLFFKIPLLFLYTYIICHVNNINHKQVLKLCQNSFLQIKSKLHK